ncbi:MAG TPA: hypothetical protein VK483_04200 [Chitinophagaceae bacterium]|nr:hypothetical protein [Chitinophagaceae bacterium]
MTSHSLKNELEEAIPRLLDMAKELTWNKLSDNFKFILTEIKDSQENFYEQRRLRKIENDKKIPVTLQELMPTLQKLYENFYDINLQIYKSTRAMTVIDIRYYPQSSLDEDYRRKVINNPPMLHSKVSIPPWCSDRKEKFDINWEHNQGWNKWKLFWLKLKLKTQLG